MTPPCTASPQLFFAPDEETGTHRAWREERAKAICRRCPVQAGCLDYALQIDDRFGIYGGLTPLERVHIRRWRREKSYRERKTVAA